MTMPENGVRPQEQAFLREQIAEIEHKITRLSNIRSGYHEGPSADGLDALLSAARAERRLLEDLHAHTTNGAPSLPLTTEIMARIRRLTTSQDPMMLRWRRGRPTPPVYWEVNNERAALEHLLRRWHAWRAGRPYYPAAANGATAYAAPAAHRNGAPARANPWDATSPLPSLNEGAASNDADKLLAQSEVRRTQLLTALEHAGITPDHVEIIFGTEQAATVTAHVHSERERRALINIILSADYVEMLFADIRVTDPRWCPVCRAQQAPDQPPSKDE